jgi:hypothetical protein
LKKFSFEKAGSAFVDKKNFIKRKNTKIPLLKKGECAILYFERKKQKRFAEIGLT